ncbi:Golgi CORVET complex core vacuolar protein 8-domain-containing protein [Lactifluus volemus]|nr:Golgi CORVET complex core vacuolar protein 8-domain-containing protein [Lactifluus volemus]
MAANGFICIGTQSGRILVFDFKQTLRCICGDPAAKTTVGAVTAVALSHDHTFVAAGHATGHIQLFDLKKPHVPARSVPPTTLAAVASGRKEGHLQGSRIVSIGFIAGRHTAIVTADQTGLAFYHSLGKALFFEASDVLRILGKYPNEEAVVPGPGPHTLPLPLHRRRPRRTNTILAMASLPLGTVPHPTDAYNVTALLTAAKLVIVGLKPSPKTWYRKHRDEDEQDEQMMGKAKFRAALSWFPSVIPSSPTNPAPPLPAKKDNTPQPPPTTPMLIYSWGSTFHLLLLSEIKTMEKITNQRTGKLTKVEVGRLVFEEKARWKARDNVHAIQWLNAKQILAVTASALEVYDVQTRTLVEHVHFDPSLLLSPTIAHTVNGAYSYPDAIGDIAHSVRTYKGKIFFLGRDEVQVGTLLTWADRILSFVENGDFLSAIDLTRSYYLGTAPGNKNGLPEDPLELRKVVGEKMRELMVASTRYAFSEDRMTDGTHHTPDGRGVDRTSLFENLAYDDAGIAPIYLERFETFVLEYDVRAVDPRIAQRLIAMHSANGVPTVVQLCQTHRLYDALIYVYTRAMRDYVAPVVEMLSLIRKVMQLRRSPAAAPDETALEPLVVNAYKVYPFLADVLSGLTYPSEEPLQDEEATLAKRDLYSFLFHGRSSTWPRGDGGKLVLTAEEEGGVEPTYPYCRMLLRFDPEAFLHALDLAFEDTYLNDETSGGASRLVIVKILLEILASSSSSSVLHAILVGLTTDVDRSTREDRQLAAEYLLSTYTPHDSEQLLRLFEDAGFYRILRTWHRQEGRWSPLLLAYLHDPDVQPPELFANIDKIFTTTTIAPTTARTRSRDSSVPADDLRATVAMALPDLLGASVIDTARFLDRHAPQLHERAIDSMGSDADHRRFAYLHCLLGPPSADDDDDDDEHPPLRSGPSAAVPPRLRNAYVALLCEIDPASAIPSLRYLSLPEYLEWDEALRICEEHEVGRPKDAMDKVEAFERRLSAAVGGILARGEGDSVGALNASGHQQHGDWRTGVAVCVERSRTQAKDVDAPVEELWFQLLHTQIGTVQAVSSCCPSSATDRHDNDDGDGVEEPAAAHHTLETLRSLVQTTFSALVSASARTTSADVGRGTPYTEFRTILTGMMEAYRAEGDMLVITKHLLDRDVFETIEMATRVRARGWASKMETCAGCRRPLTGTIIGGEEEEEDRDRGKGKITIMRTGMAYHGSCLPNQLATTST